MSELPIGDGDLLMNKELRKEEFKQYRRSAIAEMADWHEGMDMSFVSVSIADSVAGSPKVGDKIARNPKNHADKWLVASAYFADNFEPLAADEDDNTQTEETLP